MSLTNFPNAVICTYSGIAFDVLNPEPKMIVPLDIAAALSKTPRFSGHTHTFYSVAEHCVRMSQLEFMPKDLRLYALLHDAAEAYILDVPTPLKEKLPFYRTAEKNILACIFERFGLDPTYYPPEISRGDEYMLSWEHHRLMPDVPWWPHSWPQEFFPELHPWEPTQAEVNYLGQLHDLGIDTSMDI